MNQPQDLGCCPKRRSTTLLQCPVPFSTLPTSTQEEGPIDAKVLCAPSARGTKEIVNGDQEIDKQSPIPKLDDEQRHELFQERVRYKYIHINYITITLHAS